MYKYINQLLSLIYAIFIKISWLKLYKLHDKNAKHIIWFYPCYPSKPLEYLGRSMIMHDLGLICALTQLNLPFKIHIGRNIGQYHNKIIHYCNSNEFMNPYGLTNYARFIANLVKQLELQGNTLILSSDEVVFWENKAYMHNQFTLQNISQPITDVHSLSDDSQYLQNRNYPCLVKEVHSCGGKGIYKVDSYQKLLHLFNILKLEGHIQILVQDLVNMRKDLRVIVLGNEIFLHYWRLNDTKEWKKTSTSHGSTVDFITFPEQWKSYFIEVTRLLGLRTAGYDITWENDDTTTMPIILEVSPTFQPNPPTPVRYKDIPYRDYKKKIFTKDAFYIGRVNTIFDLEYRKAKLFI